jgi:hypothetical protein
LGAIWNPFLRSGIGASRGKEEASLYSRLCELLVRKEGKERHDGYWQFDDRAGRRTDLGFQRQLVERDH